MFKAAMGNTMSLSALCCLGRPRKATPITTEAASDPTARQPARLTSTPQEILRSAQLPRTANSSLSGAGSPNLLTPYDSRSASSEDLRAPLLEAVSDCGAQTPPFEMEPEAGPAARRQHSEPARAMPMARPPSSTVRASSCQPHVKYSQREADGSRWSEPRRGVGRPPDVKPTNYLAWTFAADRAYGGPQ